MDTDEKLRKERWELTYAVQRSQRYHARRSAFFDRWHKLTLLTGILGGSAVVASLGPVVGTNVTLVAGLAVAILSGVDLVVGTSEMARKHNDLRRRFCELEKEMEIQPKADLEQIAAWRAARLSIEADEPPAYVALDLLVENELRRSYAHTKDEPPYPVTWWQRLTAHFVRWENA
ncbi:hypothetical protein EIM50_13655 [Pseudoxanthomonas sp. SGD-10]|nr:hypothetical protein EIM50_13655 [Pseudoxanthomonas sp. SGD-10]